MSFGLYSIGFVLVIAGLIYGCAPQKPLPVQATISSSQYS
jgi:uncharacterized protein YjeT (DUF2065 family)